eukprot:763338-Hanusia_phi.AAC.4
MARATRTAAVRDDGGEVDAAGEPEAVELLVVLRLGQALAAVTESQLPVTKRNKRTRRPATRAAGGSLRSFEVRRPTARGEEGADPGSEKGSTRGREVLHGSRERSDLRGAGGGGPWGLDPRASSRTCGRGGKMRSAAGRTPRSRGDGAGVAEEAVARGERDQGVGGADGGGAGEEGEATSRGGARAAAVHRYSRKLSSCPRRRLRD